MTKLARREHAAPERMSLKFNIIYDALDETPRDFHAARKRACVMLAAPRPSLMQRSAIERAIWRPLELTRS